jgi:hypothetical protein
MRVVKSIEEWIEALAGIIGLLFCALSALVVCTVLWRLLKLL